MVSLQILRLGFFGDAIGVTFLHGRDVAFFTGHELLFQEEVPDTVGALSALADPVRDTILFKIEGVRIGKRVVGSKEFKGLSPWITLLFRNNDAIEWLLLFPDTGQTDG